MEEMQLLLFIKGHCNAIILSLKKVKRFFRINKPKNIGLVLLPKRMLPH